MRKEFFAFTTYSKRLSTLVRFSLMLLSLASVESSPSALAAETSCKSFWYSLLLSNCNVVKYIKHMNENLNLNWLQYFDTYWRKPWSSGASGAAW